MRRILIGVTGWLACFVAIAAARQDGMPPPSTFRAGIDVLELDVSALDKDRHPVRGLAERDFTVTIDGQPRKIVAFKAVDLPAPVTTPSAPWMRDVAPDIASNAHATGRVVVIFIDDGSFGQWDTDNDLPVADGRAIEKTRAIAKAAIDALGPDDLAAVVFSENNHTAQNFTNDRVRLTAAVDKARLFPSTKLMLTGTGDDAEGNNNGACFCGLCSIEAVQHVAEALQSLPQQRKTLLYISAGRIVPAAAPYDPTVAEMAPPAPGSTFVEGCRQRKQSTMSTVFKEAQLANVTIEAIDPGGLVVGQFGAGDISPTTARTEFLRAMAESTGGRAIIGNNNMEQDVPALLNESSSYYLLGVERPVTKDDGRVHPIKVTVDRPDVNIRTRTGYYVPSEKETKKALAAKAAHPVDASVTDALPKADFPLEAAIAPFQAPKGKAELAIVLHVTEPNASATARQEPVTIVVRAFNPETGGAVSAWRENVNLIWNASAASAGEYELLGQVPMPPGRYEFRLGVQAGGARTASVYGYTDIPKFSDEPLSLSGVVLGATPSPKSAPKDAFKDLLPIVPTARRVFQKSDRVKAFVRIYEGGSHALAPATITTHVIDSNNKALADGSQQVAITDFGATRSFGYGFVLPTQYPAGEYLLRVDVAAGTNTAQRALRFRVQ